MVKVDIHTALVACLVLSITDVTKGRVRHCPQRDKIVSRILGWVVVALCVWVLCVGLCERRVVREIIGGELVC